MYACSVSLVPQAEAKSCPGPGCTLAHTPAQVSAVVSAMPLAQVFTVLCLFSSQEFVFSSKSLG